MFRKSNLENKGSSDARVGSRRVGSGRVWLGLVGYLFFNHKSITPIAPRHEFPGRWLKQRQSILICESGTTDANSLPSMITLRVGEP